MRWAFYGAANAPEPRILLDRSDGLVERRYEIAALPRSMVAASSSGWRDEM